MSLRQTRPEVASGNPYACGRRSTLLPTEHEALMLGDGIAQGSLAPPERGPALARSRLVRIAGTSVLLAAVAAAGTYAKCGPELTTEALQGFASGFGRAPQPEAPHRELWEEIRQLEGGYWYLPTYDCAMASEPAAAEGVGPFPNLECKEHCNAMPECTGFIVGERQGRHLCLLRKNVRLPNCHRHKGWDAGNHDSTYLKHTPWPNTPSSQPIHEFYMYRVTSAGGYDPSKFGQINTANLHGVLFYLTNEIVTEYGAGQRCPRRFNVSEIHRVKVKIRTTDDLMTATGMTFGPRFAYNRGYCDGRCFPQSQCTGSGDCVVTYAKFGFVVGCNRFDSYYPFPDFKTPAPDGVWYSMPAEGRCEGDPTGAKECTWSFEDAGVITLEEFENILPGEGTCCEGRCTHIWDKPKDERALRKRGEFLTSIFAKQYPLWPATLPDPPCDFDHTKIWGPDPWVRFDPNPNVEHS